MDFRFKCNVTLRVIEFVHDVSTSLIYDYMYTRIVCVFVYTYLGMYVNSDWKYEICEFGLI